MGSRFTGTGTAAPSWRGSAAQPRGRDDVTALVPRLGLVAAHDACSAALVERMLRTATLALPAARAENGGFVFTLAGTPEPSGWRLAPRGASTLHGAVAALGLLRLHEPDQRAVLGGDTARDLIGRLAGQLDAGTARGTAAP